MNYLESLKTLTQAHIALKRAGNSIDTHALLQLRKAHINAIAALHTNWDYQTLEKQLIASQENYLLLKSCVTSKEQYLQRPDLGKILDHHSAEILTALQKQHDLVIIISDGLSALAIHHHVFNVWSLLKLTLQGKQLTVAPIILVPYARVAISDVIGLKMNAKYSLIFIGERPGTAAVDSMSIYITKDPKPTNTDANRFCISNIHPPHGLTYQEAICKIFEIIKP